MSKQWEYAVIHGEDDFAVGQGTLNCRGSVGWELVSVDNGVVYMKREKKAAEPQEPAFPAINDPWAAKAVQKVVTQVEVMQ
jgi:hypothetical protein